MTLRRAFAIAGVIVIALLVIAAVVLPLTSERARHAAVDELSKRLDSTVELDSLELGLLPMPHATGTGLVVRHEGRRDVPPLVSIRRFRVSAGLWGLVRHHVREVSVEGLDIEIPPVREGAGTAGGPGGSWVVDQLESADARLVILPDDGRGRPKVWSIHTLHLESIGDGATPFRARLTNAVPPGTIDAAGRFGPWRSDDPGATPLDGRFSFADADLSVFEGIAGILSARGTFGGSLARVSVEGETDTPHFSVDAGGQPVPLHATYHAVVDGLNGNTELERVDAFLLDTTIHADGRVVDSNPGEPGRKVQLDVSIGEGRIEDVLRLAVKSKRPMVGALTLETSLVIPPGDRDVAEKLELDGTFTLTDAVFTNVDVARKIAELSERSRGRPDAGGSEPVASDFAGRFTMSNGQLSIPAVSFAVPGAAVRMHGTYDLSKETLDFHGVLLTEVEVSEMTSGIKSFLLKLIDPLFDRDAGGAKIPIQVTGTRSDPSFGLDKSRVF